MSARKPRLASCWLDGCSGCHMSLLDIDERILDLAAKVEFVWGPFVDMKVFPEHVDVCLVEGAVSSEEDLHKIRLIRERTRILVSFGDCAVTGNVPAMRNAFKVPEVLKRAYEENADPGGRPPVHGAAGVPPLRPRATPVHEVVKVDVFIPGCPPSADTIWEAVTGLLEGRDPVLAKTPRFG